MDFALGADGASRRVPARGATRRSARPMPRRWPRRGPAIPAGSGSSPPRPDRRARPARPRLGDAAGQSRRQPAARRRPGEPALAATLGFVAGLALDEALRRRRAVARDRASASMAAAARRDRFALKWPNDVLARRRQARRHPARRRDAARRRGFAVVDRHRRQRASTRPDGSALSGRRRLRALGVAGRRRTRCSRRLSDAWAGVERVWDGGRGFAAIRALWLDRAAGIGAPVAVQRRRASRLAASSRPSTTTGRLVIRATDGSARDDQPPATCISARSATARA